MMSWGQMMRKVLCTILFLLFAVPAHAQSDLAVKFGSRESIGDMSISPDGTKVALLQPSKGESQRRY
jgi:hypothetical protein